MARTAKAVTGLTRDAGTAITATATTIDATLVTNGLTITDGGQGNGRLVLIVENTAVTPLDVTVQGGVRGGNDGDLVVPVAASGTQAIVLGDTARHQQADLDVYVDFETGFTGTVQVLRVPR